MRLQVLAVSCNRKWRFAFRYDAQVKHTLAAPHCDFALAENILITPLFACWVILSYLSFLFTAKPLCESTLLTHDLISSASRNSTQFIQPGRPNSLLFSHVKGMGVVRLRYLCYKQTIVQHILCTFWGVSLGCENFFKHFNFSHVDLPVIELENVDP